MNRFDDMIEKVMEGRSDEEVARILHQSNTESLGMIDDLIEFECNPTEEAYDLYFSKYVTRVRTMQFKCEDVFNILLTGIGKEERMVAKEVLFGDEDVAKMKYEHYLDTMREQARALGHSGEVYVDKMRQARQEVINYLKGNK